MKLLSYLSKLRKRYGRVFTFFSLSNKAFLVAAGFTCFGQILVVYLPLFQKIFRTTSLSFVDLFFVLLLSSTMLCLDTIRKKYFAKYCTEVYVNPYNQNNDKKLDKSDAAFMV